MQAISSTDSTCDAGFSLIVRGIRHVGKEGTELEGHRVGLVSEVERQPEYHNLAFEYLVAALQQPPTKVVTKATGYNPLTVRRLTRAMCITPQH